VVESIGVRDKRGGVNVERAVVSAAICTGHGTVLERDDHTTEFKLSIEGARMSLGLWWLDAAERGAVEKLPIVNLKPLFE
jgi:hypothetical protein